MTLGFIQLNHNNMKHIYKIQYTKILLGVSLWAFFIGMVSAQGFDLTYPIGQKGNTIKSIDQNSFLVHTCTENRQYQLFINGQGTLTMQKAAFEGSCHQLWTKDDHLVDVQFIDDDSPTGKITVKKSTLSGDTQWLLTFPGQLPGPGMMAVEGNNKEIFVLSSQPLETDSLWQLQVTKIDRDGRERWSYRMPTIYGHVQDFNDAGHPIAGLAKNPLVSHFSATPDGGFIYINEALFQVDFPAEFGNKNLIVKADRNGEVIWTKNIGTPGPLPHTTKINDITTDAFGRTFLTGMIQATNYKSGELPLFVYAIDGSGQVYLEYFLDGLDSTPSFLSPAEGLVITPTFDSGIVVAAQRSGLTDSIYLFRIDGDADSNTYNQITWEQYIEEGVPCELIETTAEHLVLTGSKNSKTWVLALDGDGQSSSSPISDLVLDAHLSTTGASSIQYVLSITNDGPDVANGVSIEAILERPVTQESLSVTDGSVNQDSVQLSWTIPSLLAGMTAELTLLFHTNDDAPLKLFAQVVASQSLDPDATPNNAPDQIAKEDDEAVLVWNGHSAALPDVKPEIIRTLNYSENTNGRILTAYVLTDNTRAATVGNVVVNHFYLSQDASFNAFEDVFIGQLVVDEPLGHRFDTVQFLLPNVDKGDYYLLMVTDPEDRIIEINELNNIDALPLNLDHCEPQSLFPWHEWISSLSVNELVIHSGKEGYFDHEITPFVVNAGQTIDITVEVSYSYTTYDEYISVWIDENQDGFFAETELMFNTIIDAPPSGTNTASVNEAVRLPLDLWPGSTKMRVMLSRDTFANNPCTDIEFGEIEDFTVTVSPPVASLQNLEIFPNPVNNLAHIDTEGFSGETLFVNVINQQGHLVKQEKKHQFRSAPIQLHTSTLLNGPYLISLRDLRGHHQTGWMHIQRDR